jgi:hypothetical protein
MTDRVHTITVVLSQNYNEDDAEDILNAIRMVRGVQEVTLQPVGNYDYHAARTRVRAELSTKLLQVLTPQ